VTVSIQFKNLSAVNEVPADLSARMNAVFLETANALVIKSSDLAREQVLSESRKPQSRTGRYLRSIHTEVDADSFQVVGKLASDHPQAAVLEFGSRPHVIRAKNKNSLFWPGARFPVKEVNHPGTPAFKVIGNAAERAVENAGAIFNQAMQRNFE
jgi:hypothetical protein